MKYQLSFLALFVSLLGCAPQKVAPEEPTTLAAINQELGCTAIDTSGLSWESFRPRTQEGQIYLDVIRLVQQTLDQESRLLNLNSDSSRPRPGELGKLLANRRLTNSQKRRHQQLRREFNRKIKELTANHDYYHDNRPVVLAHLPEALTADKPVSSRIAIAREIEIISALLSRSDAAARATYKTQLTFWPEGEVRYYFHGHDEQISATAAQDMRRQFAWAAQLWHEQTDGLVSFEEVGREPQTSVVADFLYGPRYHLQISFRNKNLGDVAGYATVGYHPFELSSHGPQKFESHYNRMWISPKLLTDVAIGEAMEQYGITREQALLLNRDQVRYVILHEIGHVLGLEHEHDRPGRDLYLAGIQGSKNQNKPLALIRHWRPLQQGPFVIPLPYLAVCSQAGSLRGSRYDYFSVMHYPIGQATQSQTTTLRIKNERGAYSERTVTVDVGNNIVDLRPYLGRYAFLSPLDISTVKEIYRGYY